MGPGYAHADVVSGMYGALAVLAALEDRGRTGRGTHIDLSEYEAVCTLIGASLAAASTGGDVTARGNRAVHVPAAPHGCYKCRGKDRWCVIAAFDETKWQTLCRVSGHPEWAEDKRFADLDLRQRNADDLDALIEAWTMQAEAEEVMELLQTNGVPAGVVQNAEDLARDPHLEVRGFWQPVDHPIWGQKPTDASPIRIDGCVQETRHPSPLLGSDNRYVCLELLGLTEEELDDLIEKGVIG